MRSSCYVVGELWEENVLRNCLEYCESLHKFVCSPESGCTHSKCCTQIIEWGRLRTPTFCKHQRSLPSQQHVGVVDSAECINLAGPQWTSARRPFINIKRPFLFRLIFPNTQVSSIVCASFVQHTSLLSPCSRVLLLGRFLFDVGHRRMACGQPSLQGSRSGGRELAAYGLF
eukprot:GHVS01035514.1.p1 GENE.GHVS01035514.1~~GHVS01035514.1.p1  ORF type:complete len:172 (+),score=15.02 GHVS01035514.1:70-585(+)